MADIEVVALPYNNNLNVHFKTARNAAELEFLLQELAGYVALSGRAPCLHIQCHGDAEGLQLSNGSRMLWSRLKPLLVNINLASRMNLFLVLASCQGGYFAAECRYHEPVPFVYIVGPGNKITADHLLALSIGFYTELLRTRDVTQALTVAGAARLGISYFSMSAVGIFRTALTARIRNVGSRESRAQIRTIEEPLFEKETGLLTEERYGESFRFIHLTFCEFFAAYEAVQGQADGWSSLISSHRSATRDGEMQARARLAEVVPFACGLMQRVTRQQRQGENS